MKHYSHQLSLLTVISTVLATVNPTLAINLELPEIESAVFEVSSLQEETDLLNQDSSENQLSSLSLNFPYPEALTHSETIPEIIAQNRDTPRPEIMFPNPQILIDGQPAPTANPIQPIAPVPPFLPRAVAPPVGDIAVSNIDSSPTYVDLGTAARVPRLVLREAPVQEVLNLLARAADLNVVYTSASAEGGATTSSTITLDLENESVQDVFNSVLIVSGLQATRRGRTIFIGAALPNQARDLITRSFRLNQVKVDDAKTFLDNMTASEGATAGNQALLAGMQVITDPRLNALTLIGEPRQIDIASKFLMQLDARQRQVAVNVKIVDVNLLNTDNVNTSFSFGVGDNFFAVNNGALAGNFGTLRPAPGVYGTDGVVSPAVIANPLSSAQTFIKPETQFIPAAGFLGLPLGQTEGTPQLFQGILTDNPNIPPIGLLRIVDSAQLSNDPLQLRITDITSSDVTTALPNLIQYPSRFLASLNTQITQGSAKILTDPTLVVQSGQTANVNLTQEVFGGFEIQYVQINNVSTPIQRPIIKQAGLQLEIQVETIDDNGFVTLQVKPTVSAPGNDVPTNQGPITLIQSRTLSSGSVRMRDGQTLILAGIIQETDRASVTKVPILGDIPILGALFRSSSTTRQRNEVIVLVTPQIIDDSQQAGWGYNYVPGQEARGLLEERGFYVPAPNF